MAFAASATMVATKLYIAVATHFMVSNELFSVSVRGRYQIDYYHLNSFVIIAFRTTNRSIMKLMMSCVLLYRG